MLAVVASLASRGANAGNPSSEPAGQSIIHRVIFQDYSAYHTEIITEAIKHTQSKQGTYGAIPTKIFLPSLRVFEKVVEGEVLNVFWGPALPEFKYSKLLTIDVPLVQGLAGCRILMIKDGTQATFDHKKMDEINFGLGIGWVETRIFAHNNLQFETFTNIETLFKTLSQGRYDALPLGADMAARHLAASRDHVDNLALEDSLLIYYPMPTLLYVSGKCPQIADALESGIREIRRNGKMKEIFKKHYGKIFARLKMEERKVVILDNPTIRRDITPVEFPCTMKF